MKNSAKLFKDDNGGRCCQCQNSSRDCKQHYGKEELNTIVLKSINAALKQKCCSNHGHTKEANDINKFSSLSISSSDSDGISHT
eukprot:13351938-Ditylum_brightwellii.AAC.1